LNMNFRGKTTAAIVHGAPPIGAHRKGSGVC
jgi:hypothetical protein